MQPWCICSKKKHQRLSLITSIIFSEYNQPEGNHYYTIDQSEFKEDMDEPEQVLASVINTLKKEQK